MKALQCVELGGPEKLVVNEVADPVIAEDHIILKLNLQALTFLMC